MVSVSLTAQHPGLGITGWEVVMGWKRWMGWGGRGGDGVREVVVSDGMSTSRGLVKFQIIKRCNIFLCRCH